MVTLELLLIRYSEFPQTYLHQGELYFPPSKFSIVLISFIDRGEYQDEDSAFLVSHNYQSGLCRL